MTSRRIQFLFRCLVSAGLIAFILRKVDWRALGATLDRVDFRWALSGVALTFFMIVLLNARWQLFLKQQQLEVRFSAIFGLIWAGQFFNSILPGSTGGDVVKIYQLCRLFPERKAAVAASVVADRLTALIILLLLGGFGFLLQPVPLQAVLQKRPDTQAVITWGAGLAALGAITAWIVWRFLRSSMLAGKIRRILNGVRQCFSFNRRLATAILYAFVLHVVNFSIVFLFGRSLGLTLTYGQVLCMMPVILLVVMIPVTINGHGLREILYISYFGAMGVSIAQHPEVRVQDLAVALSILVVANDLLWSVPGGIWYFLNFRARPPSPANPNGSRILS